MYLFVFWLTLRPADILFFFFQAEDGIRDVAVTGVQTCALPIYGVLVYFGYPQAHEDDAERAVRAGLSAIDSVGRLDIKSVRLQARVGIATGLVVVGDLVGAGSAQEQSVVGETPNLAARLQALAEPGAVVIAAGTRRLVGDLFEVRDLGTVEVKGVAEPVPTWQLLRPSVVASRFEALRGSALTPLVGRDEEI